MKTWEIDVLVRVKKTLIMSGSMEESSVRKIIESTLKPGGIALGTFAKGVSNGFRPIPVEEICDNDPQIVEIREVTEEGVN